METVVQHLSLRCDEELARHPLYGWLRAPNEVGVDAKRKLDAFVPILNFAMTFPYYNLLYLRYSDAEESASDQADQPLRLQINKHAEEDATHVHFLLNDIKQLNLGKSWGLEQPSDLLWALWSAPSMDAARGNLSERTRFLLQPENAPPLQRYLQVEQIERDGHHLFSAFTDVASCIEKRTGVKARYFGVYHLDRETGHAVHDESLFRSAALTSEQRSASHDLIDHKHALSLEMNDIMLDFATAHDAHPTVGSALRCDKDAAIQAVADKLRRHERGEVQPLTWSISPSQNSCDPHLFDAWSAHHAAFLQHDVVRHMQNAAPERCESMLRATMVFFANRMLSLRAFNLADLEGPYPAPPHERPTDARFRRIRRLFATHASLFFHDWHQLNIDSTVQLLPHQFLRWSFLHESHAVPEMLALHAFRREAMVSATCATTRLWCYLSVNCMAAAFTKGTRVLAQRYTQHYPERPPLAYMQGLLHLLYDDVDHAWNDPHMTVPLYAQAVTTQQRRCALQMMQTFVQHGIKQWDALARFFDAGEDMRLADYFAQQRHRGVKPARTSLGS